MKKKLYWALTPDLADKRKKALDVFSDVYSIQTQVMEQPEPPIPAFVAEKDSPHSIYIFELNTNFSFEHSQIINRIFKFKAPRNALLIGSLDGTDKLKHQALNNWLPYLDGVITQSQELADEIAMMHIYSAEFVPFPKSDNTTSRGYCLKKFADFLKRVQLVKCANKTMDKVSSELIYLGVSDDAILINAVAETLGEFWE